LIKEEQEICETKEGMTTLKTRIFPKCLPVVSYGFNSNAHQFKGFKLPFLGRNVGEASHWERVDSKYNLIIVDTKKGNAFFVCDRQSG
jgi:hypothetical protein